uniref:Uncharacterized protein n=1 Tax=Oryza brachyantha TaxID=4533 RepID=J3M828_ORYBR
MCLLITTESCMHEWYVRTNKVHCRSNHSTAPYVLKYKYFYIFFEMNMDIARNEPRCSDSFRETIIYHYQDSEFQP